MTLAVSFAASVLLPALRRAYELRQARATVVTVRVEQTTVADAVEAAFTDLEWNAYDVVSRVGAIALLGLSLGSLAPLAAILVSA